EHDSDRPICDRLGAFTAGGADRIRAMKFTIRDLFWLTAIVALAAAAYVDRVQLQRKIDRCNDVSELQAQRTAAEISALRSTISELSEQKRILQHQNDNLSISLRPENPS